MEQRNYKLGQLWGLQKGVNRNYKSGRLYALQTGVKELQIGAGVTKHRRVINIVFFHRISIIFIFLEC